MWERAVGAGGKLPRWFDIFLQRARSRELAIMVSFDSLFLVACAAQLVYNITWVYTVIRPHENIKMDELKIFKGDAVILKGTNTNLSTNQGNL